MLTNCATVDRAKWPMTIVPIDKCYSSGTHGDNLQNGSKEPSYRSRGKPIDIPEVIVETMEAEIAEKRLEAFDLDLEGITADSDLQTKAMLTKEDCKKVPITNGNIDQQ